MKHISIRQKTKRVMFALSLLLLVSCTTNSSKDSISEISTDSYRNALSQLEGLRHPGFADRPDELTIPTGISPKIIPTKQHHPRGLLYKKNAPLVDRTNGLKKENKNFKLSNYESISTSNNTWEEIRRGKYQDENFYYIFSKKSIIPNTKYQYLSEYYEDSNYSMFLGSYFEHRMKGDETDEYYDVFYDQNHISYYELYRIYTDLTNSEYDTLYEEYIETNSQLSHSFQKQG